MQGTSDEVATTVAREVLEPRQGYGAAIRRGLAEVEHRPDLRLRTGRHLQPARPDEAAALHRGSDLVVGSRTVSNFIWDGANMGWFLQWGNWAVAKFIEALFNTSYLSDVGCTFRVISRSLIPACCAMPAWTAPRSGWRMRRWAGRAVDPIVQVPVNYHPRGRHLGGHRPHWQSHQPRAGDDPHGRGPAFPSAPPPITTRRPPTNCHATAEPQPLRNPRADSPGPRRAAR